MRSPSCALTKRHRPLGRLDPSTPSWGLRRRWRHSSDRSRPQQRRISRPSRWGRTGAWTMPTLRRRLTWPRSNRLWRRSRSVDDVKVSVDTIKSEVTKFTSMWDREARAHPFTKSGILGEHESASSRSPAGDQADDPNRHCVEHNHRENGFGHVYAQTHLPLNGTPDPFPPNSSRIFGSPHDTLEGVLIDHAVQGT